MAKSKTYSANDLQEILKELSCTKSKPQEVPEGWYSSAQLMKELGIKRSLFHNRVSASIEAGTVEMKRFSIIDKNGTLRSIPHYRKVKK